jgi:hypothetical protein
VNHFIKQSAPSSRVALNNYQREHFCSLIEQLVERALAQHEVRVTSDLPEDGWESFTQTREYLLFLTGAYACGFVCADLRPNIDLDEVNRNPEAHIARFELKKLRHYVHTLMRAERANHGFGSSVWESMRTGALELLLHRLAHDGNLLEPL